jgi:hypothetical protein
MPEPALSKKTSNSFKIDEKEMRRLLEIEKKYNKLLLSMDEWKKEFINEYNLEAPIKNE